MDKIMNVFDRPGLVRLKEDELGSPSTTNIYGRYSIFNECASGDVFGLQVQTHGLLNWIGWRPNKFYRRRVDFITWIGPEGTSDGAAQSGAGAPCDDPTVGFEYGQGGYELTHSSWYHWIGDPLDPHTVVQDRCETSPRYRLNGQIISDDVEWQMNGIMTVMQQAMRRHVVHGSHLNAHEMNGLESLIKTGYLDDLNQPMPMVDSILVGWNDNLDGLVNGYGNFFDYMDEVINEIEYRATAMGNILETDMILLTSRFMATCLLDAYACYTTCGVTDAGDVTDQALRAQQRANRLSLNGGPLYDGAAAVGFIQLKSGRRLPVMVDDSLDIGKALYGWDTDIYLLTRRIGSQDVLYGEYLDMRVYENRIKKFAKMFSATADAAGRFVTKAKEDNWCFTLMMGTSPEIYLSAPWAQARISGVSCAKKRTPVSGDPFQTGYLPGGGVLYKASASLY
jgi:hypothetical protein